MSRSEFGNFVRLSVYFDTIKYQHGGIAAKLGHTHMRYVRAYHRFLLQSTYISIRLPNGINIHSKLYQNKLCIVRYSKWVVRDHSARDDKIDRLMRINIKSRVL